MRKHFVLALSVSLLSATLAFGAEHKTKIKSFVPIGAENADADGMAMLLWKSNENATTVQIILNDFTPNVAYDLDLLSPSSGERVGCNVLATNEHGRVHYQTTIPGDITDSDVLIYLSDDCNFTEEELRAIGPQPEKTHIRSFTPVNGENPAVNGKAVLRYNEHTNQTSVRIFLNNFAPDTVYDLDLYDNNTQNESVGCDVLHMNHSGRVHYDTLVTGNVTDISMLIYLSDDCSFSDDELRAFGTPSP